MIRKLTPLDRDIYLEFTGMFYSSEAVMADIPYINREKTFDELMRSDDYVICYIIEYQGNAAGYALLCKTYVQEVGGLTYWIDELFVAPEYRSKGLGKEFFDFIMSQDEGIKRFRLEFEPDNEGAARLYRRLGFKDMPYSQMYMEL